MGCLWWKMLCLYYIWVYILGVIHTMMLNIRKSVFVNTVTQCNIYALNMESVYHSQTTICVWVCLCMHVCMLSIYGGTYMCVARIRVCVVYVCMFRCPCSMACLSVCRSAFGCHSIHSNSIQVEQNQWMLLAVHVQLSPNAGTHTCLATSCYSPKPESAYPLLLNSCRDANMRSMGGITLGHHGIVLQEQKNSRSDSVFS